MVRQCVDPSKRETRLADRHVFSKAERNNELPHIV